MDCEGWIMSAVGVTRVVRTSAGLCAMWQPESFRSLEDDFELWEDWATEDREIESRSAEGHS